MSKAGEIGSPYRPPCAGWASPPRLWLNCGNHYRPADSAIPTHVNVTLVNPGDPIAPYPRLERFTSSCSADPICDPGAHGEPTCDPWPLADRPGGVNGVACHAVDPTHETVAFNCFQADGGVANLARCRTMGFKNAQALKSWFGRFPWTRLDNVNETIEALPTGTISGGDCLCSSSYEPERTAVDGTKYRTLEVTEDVNYPISERTSYRKVTVERFTGRQVRDASSDSNNPVVPGRLGDPTYTPSSPFSLQSAIAMFYQALGGGLGFSTPDYGMLFGFTPPVAADISGTLGEWSFSVDQRDGSGNGNVVSAALSVSGGYFHSTGDKYNNLSGVDGVLVKHIVKNLDLTNTTSDCYVSDQGYGEGDQTYGPNIYTLNATLSNPYTATMVKQDIETLLATWNLADDKVYPWRTDNWVTVAPMVVYDEFRGSREPYMVPSQIFNNVHNPDYPGTADDDAWILAHLDTWVEEGYADSGSPGGTGLPNSPAYSGDVRGAPLPAGYDKYFDFDHVTYRCCRDFELGFPIWYPYAYGAFSGQSNASDSTDAAVPGTATKWTENHGSLGASQCFAGAWMVYDTAGFFWAQKWAEIKNPRPSYNFFGPCGSDRFRYNETLVGCVSSYDAGTKTVTLIHGVAGMTSGVGMICGIDAGTDGVWNFTRTSDTVYVLTGTRLYESPTRTDCANATFGKLLFPSAWPICGRVSVTSTSAAGGTVTVNCNTAPYLRTGDAVDFTDSAGSVIESNKTVTVVSETQFTFSGSVPVGTFVISHGAPLWWWYDNRPKGSYLLATWTHNFRDYQERQRVIDQAANCDCAAVTAGSPIRSHQEAHGMPQSVSAFTVARYCLGWTPCSPQVMCSSPNGETWSNGTTHGWPDSFPLDERYGSRWQALVIQEVNDYLFQRVGDTDTEVDSTYSDPTTWPHIPCDIQSNNDDPEADHIFWQEDQGNCSPDDATHRYFPFRRLVEPELTLPVVGGVTAPALPAGFYLGFLSLADLDTASNVNGNVLIPPVAPDADCETNEPFQFQTPWGLYIVMQGCVCSDPKGRFHVEYEDMNTFC